jgi:GT2 family glycosyltransferase
MSKHTSKSSVKPDATPNLRQQENKSNDNGVIVVNTDSMEPPQPGDGLVASRKNKVIAKLGDNSQLVSVYLMGFNRLEKTRKSLESILKYTKEIDIELVLVDNGSADGTLDYYKSIEHPRKKIIRVTKNIGAYDPSWDHLTGRYIVSIPNDVYVTENWLANMLKCAKSDDRIGMVVPVSSNVSNYQSVDLNINTIDEMYEQAAQHNVSDLAMWHERLRLLPVVGLYKREALDMTGKFDYGFFHDFADDDITFRMRRAGYKTVLCKDTFVHHDHNYAKDKDPEVFQRSLEAGRDDFKRKYYGIDSWDDVNNYEPVMISLVEPQEVHGCDGVNILGVDVLCGTPILELKNKLRESQVYDVKLSAFSTDAKYWLDLKTICDGEVIVDRLEYLDGYFPDVKFDYIILGKPINAYTDPFKLLRVILKFLKKGGHFLVKLRNAHDLTTLVMTMGGNVKTNLSDNYSVYQIRLDEFLHQINNLGCVHKKIVPEFLPLDENAKNTMRNLITNAGIGNDPNDAFTRAAVRDYVFDVVWK